MRKFTLNPIVLAMAVSAMPAATFAQELEEVLVTGSYAQSLKNALNVKRESTGIVDSVFAEDVGKFPDQNLAESLGRIPGVAIEQDDGEGRSITVRGLGDAYTMVTVNGMPSQSLAAGSGGVRTSRAFDFNVFASELFSRLDVYKSTSGELEDGSLGATVGLRTARPFDYDEFAAAANVEAGYYDGSGAVKPRLSGLVSVSNDTMGFLASVAYSQKEAPLTGAESGRWNAQSGSNRLICPADVCGDDATLVRSSWHPRIARYADKTNDQDRLGVTSSFQWQIADETLLSIDGLYSKIDVTRDEPFMQAISLARNDATGMRQMSVVDYVVDSNMTLVSAEVTDADFRSEAFRADWSSEFNQLSLDLQHEFSDKFRMNVLAGMTESKLDNREVTVIYEHFSSNDSRDYVTYADSSDSFSWDYSNMKSPVLSYSFDTTNPANWEFSEYRDRIYDATSDTDMARIDFAYDLADGYTAKFGATQKSYGYQITESRADRTFAQADVINGGAKDGDACGITAAVDANDGYLQTAGGRSFFYPDFNRRTEFQDSGCWGYVAQPGNTRDVEEEVFGYFAQIDIDTELFGNRLRGNIGVREAETDLRAEGITIIDSVATPVVVKHSYSDTLPSLTLAYNLTEDLVLRGAAAKVLARPELTDLNPGGSITTFGNDPKVSYGNPYIEPFRANSFDLGLEWYYSDDALAGITLFQKDVESFPTSDNQFDIPWPQLGLPNSLLGGQVDTLKDALFDVSYRVNGGGGNIQGAEFAWQQQLSFLPGPDWMRGFGFQANYTFLDEAELDSGREMVNVSKDSYNFTLYWEGEKFQARITNSYRGEYYSNINSDNPWQNRVVDDSNYVGVSASYDVTEQLKITFKGVNITDESKHEYETEGVARLVLDHSAGASYFVGASYKF